MLPVFFFFLLFFNLLLFLSGRKDRPAAFFTLIFVILFAIGRRYDGSSITHDLRNYELKYYDYDDLSIIEYGFRGLTMIGNKIGLSYEEFYMLVTAILILLFVGVVIKLKSNSHLFLFSYMAYFMTVTTGQMRNQLALACMIIMLPVLYKSFRDEDKFYKIKVLLCLILAASFHVSFILYILPFLFATSSPPRHIKLFFLALIAIFVFLLRFQQVSVIQNLILLLIADSEYMGDRFMHYTETTAGLSFLAPSSIMLLTLFGLYCWRKYIVLPSGNNGLIKFSNYIFNVSLLSTLFLPLLLLNATLYRYPRDITLLAIISMGMYISYKNKFIHRFTIMCVVVGIVAGWFIFDVFLKGYWDDYSKFFFNTLFL